MGNQTNSAPRFSGACCFQPVSFSLSRLHLLYSSSSTRSTLKPLTKSERKPYSVWTRHSQTHQGPHVCSTQQEKRRMVCGVKMLWVKMVWSQCSNPTICHSSTSSSSLSAIRFSVCQAGYMCVRIYIGLTVVAVVGCQLAKAKGLHIKPCLLQVPDARQAAGDAVGLAVARHCCEGFTQCLEACGTASTDAMHAESAVQVASTASCCCCRPTQARQQRRAAATH